MKKLLTLCILPFFFSCQSWIKNESLAEEHTVEIPQEIAYQEPEINEDLTMNQTEDFLGYWVGFFEADESLLDTSITNKMDYYLDRMKKNNFFHR